jgi:hypothetical protein
MVVELAPCFKRIRTCSFTHVVIMKAKAPAGKVVEDRGKLGKGLTR